MATVKARSLKMMDLIDQALSAFLELPVHRHYTPGTTYEGTAGAMLDLGPDLVSSWSRCVFSDVLMRRWVAMFVNVVVGPSVSSFPYTIQQWSLSAA